jgi:hypothetical protein
MKMFLKNTQQKSYIYGSFFYPLWKVAVFYGMVDFSTPVEG